MATNLQLYITVIQKIQVCNLWKWNKGDLVYF